MNLQSALLLGTVVLLFLAAGLWLWRKRKRRTCDTCGVEGCKIRSLLKRKK